MKIVLFPFQMLFNVGLCHLILHKVSDQPVEMTKESGAASPPPRKVGFG